MAVYVLIGLPGIGKSTWAHSRYVNAQIFSSDEYRERLYGDVNDMTHNNEVFTQLYADMEQALIEGEFDEIVFDATNLNIKRRKHVIDMVHKYGEHARAVVFTEPLDTILAQNKQRDRVVPEESIRQKHKTFHVPVVTESWDSVEYVGHSPYDWHDYESVSSMAVSQWTNFMCNDGSRIGAMKGFNQHNPHHTLDLWEHTIKTVEHLRKHGAHWRLMLAALYHDIGKLDTQTFDENGVAHYYGHQYVSTQIAIQELRTIMAPYDLLYITSLIHYHMNLYNHKIVSNVAKLARRLGDARLLNDLLLLHEADVLAH